MGVKRSLQGAASKVTTRMKESGVARRLSAPGSTNSLRTRGIEWLYLLILFLLAAGLINALSNAGSAGINNAPIVASPNAQNITETFIVLFAYIVGSLGSYGLYLAGRQTIRARSAEMFFIGGIALISLAVTIGYYIISIK
ncbi:MAG TPA: hypothetical protein VFF30_00115 [Nitrososphaerales archaeon]|nr:hypothetical protein [Nitrososphaerales archaeon]